MFTGIIEETGVVKKIQKGANCSVFTIQGNIIFQDLHLGDSVAVNGICLTAASISGTTFCADVMHETLNRSSLGRLTCGSPVNLERALSVNGRFGGHMVSGHIDGVGIIRKIRQDGNAIWYTISAEKKILRYIVEKGSVAVDGISLTVATVTAGDFSISTIPHTVKSTVLLTKKTGDPVNVENDVIGKYIEKLSAKGINHDFLTKYEY